MPVLSIPESGLSLGTMHGAANPSDDLPEAFGIVLSESVIEDMIKCIRNGRTIQLSMGDDPRLEYDSKTHELSTTEDSTHTEYYRTTFDSLPNDRSSAISMPGTSFFGFKSKPTYKIRTEVSLVNPYAAVGTNVPRTITRTKPAANPSKPAPPATAGADAALENLKNSLEQEKARKLENTTKHIKDASVLSTTSKQKGAVKPSNKNRFLSQNGGSLTPGTTRSMPSSPAFHGVSSPSMAPTSVPLSQQQAEWSKFVRRPIIHRLAVQPETESSLMEYKDDKVPSDEYKAALRKVADLEGGKWALKKKLYRELEIFKYEGYKSMDERLAAREHARREYDRMRLGPNEPEWRRLLTEDEQARGVVLSKLHAKTAGGPITKPLVRERAEDSERDTGAEDGNENDLFGDKLDAPQSSEMTRSISNPPLTKSKKVSEKEAQAKRLLSKTNKTQDGRVTKTASTKHDTMAPQKDVKYKSSEFVNDSDDSDEDIQPTRLVAKPSSRMDNSHIDNSRSDKSDLNKKITAKARPTRDDAPAKAPNTNSKPKQPTNTSTMKSSPLASPPTNASDIEEHGPSTKKPSPTKSLKRKAESDAPPQHSSSSTNAPTLPPAKRHQKTDSSASSDSSINSANGIGSGTQKSLGKGWAEKKKEFHALVSHFNKLYPAYLEKYAELSGNTTMDEKVREDKLGKLHLMNERLADLKQRILALSSGGGKGGGGNAIETA